jgi:hypothetical protein
VSRYTDAIPEPKCNHKRKGLVTSGSLDPGYVGPLASHAVCDREACIADAKEWAYALTHIDPVVRMDADRRPGPSIPALFDAEQGAS